MKKLFRLAIACILGVMLFQFFIYEDLPKDVQWNHGALKRVPEPLSREEILGLVKEAMVRENVVASLELDQQIEKVVQKVMRDFKRTAGGGVMGPKNNDSMDVNFPHVEQLEDTVVKRILVTGGAGFVGSHLVDKLMNQGHHVIVMDNLFTGRRKNIQQWWNHPNFEFVTHDVINPFFREVDEIYHLACPASPPHYQYNPVKVRTRSRGFLILTQWFLTTLDNQNKYYGYAQYAWIGQTNTCEGLISFNI